MFKAEMPVSYEDIMYAFVGTIETGYDWFHNFEALDTPPATLAWYADPEFFKRPDFKIEVTVENPEEGDDTVIKTIGPVEIQEGLNLMAKHSPDDLANLVSESGADVNTYDVFMQYVVFGEIIYG